MTQFIMEAKMDKEKIKKAVKDILEAIGEDPAREGLKNTPKRVAEMYEEILGGMNRNADDDIEVFFEKEHDEIILLKDIPLYSVCEHHMVPFIGKAHVAYIPDNNRITGLSKIARVVDTFARRLQVQERLTTEIAEVLMRKLKPQGVLVIIEAEHLCMSMRGVKKPGILTTTSAVRGVFRTSQKTRSEALSLIRHYR
ncbi:MAG: GTP cyclohydrolase I FolE [Candidatus Omnitrophota bacterium]